MTAGKYAEGTVVPVVKTRGEIETVLQRYGATAFAYGWDQHSATIGFEAGDRRYLIRLPLPDPNAEAFTLTRHRDSWNRRQLGAASAQVRYDAELRRRWRALLLVIKAKLEAVASGIATLEQEFFYHLLLPDGRTVGEASAPAIETAYQTGNVPELLPGGER